MEKIRSRMIILGRASPFHMLKLVHFFISSYTAVISVVYERSQCPVWGRGLQAGDISGVLLVPVLSFSGTCIEPIMAILEYLPAPTPIMQHTESYSTSDSCRDSRRGITIAAVELSSAVCPLLQIDRLLLCSCKESGLFLISGDGDSVRPITSIFHYSSTLKCPLMAITDLDPH